MTSEPLASTASPSFHPLRLGRPRSWAELAAYLSAASFLRVAQGPASLVLFLSAAFGTAFFRPEYGLYTFGPACVFAGAVYLREMQRSLFTPGNSG